jgi:hypothetical protein
MTVNQQTPTDFEERLLSRLQATVAERGAAEAEAEAARVQPVRRRAPRLALGGAVAAAAVTAGLIVSAGGDNAPAAYAIEPQDGGGVDIEVYNLSDPTGLEGALEEAGIPSQVNYLPAGMTCREPHFQPSTTTTPQPDGGLAPFRIIDMGGAGTMTIGIGDLQPGEVPANQPANTIYFDPANFASDQTLILTGSPAPYGGDPTGGSVAQVRVAEGEVGPCEPVPDQVERGLLTEP